MANPSNRIRTTSNDYLRPDWLPPRGNLDHSNPTAEYPRSCELLVLGACPNNRAGSPSGYVRPRHHCWMAVQRTTLTIRHSPRRYLLRMSPGGSMIAVPKKRYDGSIRFIYGEPSWVWFECEVTQPPSAVGRTIHVALDPPDVAALLIHLRRAAIAARQQPLEPP